MFTVQYSGVELLGHMVTICLLLKEIWNCFPNQQHHLALSPALLTFITVFCFLLFYCSHPGEYKTFIIPFHLIFISIMTNNVYTFPWAFWPFITFLKVYANPFQIFNGLFVFSLLSYKSSLSYSQYHSLIRYTICKYFCHFGGFLFTLMSNILICFISFIVHISSLINFSSLSFLEIWHSK